MCILTQIYLCLTQLSIILDYNKFLAEYKNIKKVMIWLFLVKVKMKTKLIVMR